MQLIKGKQDDLADMKAKLEAEKSNVSVDDDANARQNCWQATLQLKVKQQMMDKMEEEQKKLLAEMDKKEEEMANINKDIENKEKLLEEKDEQVAKAQVMLMIKEEEAESIAEEIRKQQELYAELQKELSYNYWYEDENSKTQNKIHQGCVAYLKSIIRSSLEEKNQRFNESEIDDFYADFNKNPKGYYWKDSQTKDHLFAVLDFSEFKKHMLDQSYFTPPKRNIFLYNLIKRTAMIKKVYNPQEAETIPRIEQVNTSKLERL